MLAPTAKRETCSRNLPGSELSTKRLGEISERVFALAAARRSFSVSNLSATGSAKAYPPLVLSDYGISRIVKVGSSRGES
jgi:hypothetical protein